MVDLVGTCPKSFWEEWIAEGDAAGDPESGEEWGWYTRNRDARLIRPDDRFYVVAHGRLRGYAPVTVLKHRDIPKASVISKPGREWMICRRGGAVAVTIEEEISGFRGLRKRWWPYEAELPFPDWRSP